MIHAPSGAMLDEIREQPALLAEILARRETLTAPFVQLCRTHPIKRVFFVGNGSPYYGGCTLAGAAERLLHADATAVPAGYFGHHGSFGVPECYRPEEVLLVCPAESGHSRGQVDAARRAKALGIPVLCTTLNPTGVLARECDVVLPKAGVHEVAMAATKGQTMALLLILLCFIDAGAALGNLTAEEHAQLLAACEALPANIGRSIENTLAWFSANEARVMGAEQFFLLGYGANYGTVQEAALKFYECHQRPTMAMEMEESLHGPFRALHKNDMVFFVCAEDGPERARMKTLADALQVYCGNRVLLQREDARAPGEDTLPVATGDVEFVNAIEYLVPLQVLAHCISARMGIDLTVPLVSALDGVMLPGYPD